MACTVTVTSVIGVPDLTGAPGAISAITVTGTTSVPFGLIGLLCPCFLGGEAATRADTNGNWQITVSAARIDRQQSVCQCGESISIEVLAADITGKNCGGLQWGPTSLSCTGCAAAATVTAECNPDGTNTVTFTLVFAGALEVGSMYSVIWVFGDPNGTTQTSSGTVPGAGLPSVQTQFSYPTSGSYPASAVVSITPASTGKLCSNFAVRLATAGSNDVVVPACWPCPTLSWVPDAGDPAKTVTVTGCVPDQAVVQAAVSLTWPAGTINPPSAQDYKWFIQGPNPAASQGQWSATTPGPSVSTSDSIWTDIVGNQGVSVVFQTAGSYAINVTAEIPGVPSNCAVEAATTFNLSECNGVPCPVITSLTATPPSGPAPLTVTLLATVNNPGAVAGGFQWTFGDTTSLSGGPNPVTHPYTAPGTYGAAVTVNGPPGCKPSTATTTVTVTGGTPTKAGCGVLLILAVILNIVGGLVFLVAMCTSIFWLEIVGGAIALIGLILFIIWAIVCAAFTSCGVMQTVQCLLAWMVEVVGPIMALLAWLFGGDSFVSACFLASVATWAGWGTMFAWLVTIMSKLHCPTKVCL